MELRHSCLIVAARETSFTLRGARGATLQLDEIIRLKTASFTFRGATGVTLQLRQVLPLLRKMTLMIDPRDTWNVQYNARSIRSLALAANSDRWISPNIAPVTKTECATSPNSAPATKSDSWTSTNIAPATRIECATWMQLHQIPLARKSVLLYCVTLLFFYVTIRWLYFSFTLQFFCSTIFLPYFSFTLLFFCSIIFWLYYSLALRSRWYIGRFSIIFFLNNLLFAHIFEI